MAVLKRRDHIPATCFLVPCIVMYSSQTSRASGGGCEKSVLGCAGASLKGYCWRVASIMHSEVSILSPREEACMLNSVSKSLRKEIANLYFSRGATKSGQTLQPQTTGLTGTGGQDASARAAQEARSYDDCYPRYAAQMCTVNAAEEVLTVLLMACAYIYFALYFFHLIQALLKLKDLPRQDNKMASLQIRLQVRRADNVCPIVQQV